MKLVYFSWIRERLNLSDEVVDLPKNVTTLGELLTWQKSRGEMFEFVFEHEKIVRVALNREHVDDHDAKLEGIDEVAFFPPMTGG